MNEADLDLGITEEAAHLHAQSLIIDALYIGRWSEKLIDRLRTAGVSVVHTTLAVWENFRDTMDTLALWFRRFEALSDQIMLVRSAQDIREAKETGKLGNILGFQNLTPIEDDIYLLSLFQRLGVRVVQLAYNFNSLAAGSSRDRVDGGLTEFGVLTIEELNRLGMLIDISHVGDQSSLEAVELSKMPVAVTHANPRALHDIPRNKPDEVLAAVAKKGGVIGASVLAFMLPSRYEAEPTLEDYLDVIDYLVGVVGVEHVGIGTDFTEDQPLGMPEWWMHGRMRKRFPPEEKDTFPIGLESSVALPRITAGLLRRGYPSESVEKILGGNFHRLFETVWSHQESFSKFVGEEKRPPNQATVPICQPPLFDPSTDSNE